MASPKLAPYALTTTQIIKDRLELKINDKDDLIVQLINRATDWIQNQCNRKFLRTTYSNELYSVYGPNQVYLILNQAPVVPGSLSLYYRAGLPSNPLWTPFIVDQYELLEDGQSGMVRVYGPLTLARYINNAVRASYAAGYLIDWDNQDDPTKHNLPGDLSYLCENLVVRFFKRRSLGDKKGESFNGANIQWKDSLADEDTATLRQYQRVPKFF